MSTEAGVQNASKGIPIGKIFLYSLSLGAACLGVWQTKRYFWKVQTISDEAKCLSEDVTILSSSTNLLSDLESNRGRRVLLQGTFDHSREILLGPRSPPAGLVGQKAQGMAVNPQGYFVITPFTSNGVTIFVNRGWIPLNNDNSWSRPEGNVSINAVVAKFEEAKKFSPANDQWQQRKMLWLEKPVMNKAAGFDENAEIAVVEQVAVDPKTDRVLTFPAMKDSKTLTEHYITPETHIAYAFSWYSLAIAGILMTKRLYRPKRKFVRPKV